MTHVTAETNLNGKKTRKSPVPQDAARITEGALNLSLKERVALRDRLTMSIDAEFSLIEAEYSEAKKLTGKE